MERLDTIKAVLRSHVPQFAQRIAPVYALLNWEWGDGVPNEDAIAETLYELIGRLEDEPDGDSASTGGLEVGYEFDAGLELFIRFEDELRFFALGIE